MLTSPVHARIRVSSLGNLLNHQSVTLAMLATINIGPRKL